MTLARSYHAKHQQSLPTLSEKFLYCRVCFEKIQFLMQRFSLSKLAHLFLKMENILRISAALSGQYSLSSVIVVVVSAKRMTMRAVDMVVKFFIATERTNKVPRF